MVAWMKNTPYFSLNGVAYNPKKNIIHISSYSIGGSVCMDYRGIEYEIKSYNDSVSDYYKIQYVIDTNGIKHISNDK